MDKRQLFLRNLAQTSDEPLQLEIERAEGVYLYGPDGQKYIDLISGIGVSNTGHSHPKVVQAALSQSMKHMHLMVYGEFVQTPQVAFGKYLIDQLDSPLEQVYFLNSGSEAIETALKLAKRYTKREKVVSFEGAYHGSSHGALSMIGEESFRRNYRPLLPGHFHIPYGATDDFELIDERTACVVVEPVQAETGVTVPPKTFLPDLHKRCKEVGALLILDEVQSGMGRCGKLFHYKDFDFVPDILVSAKALGGGMPLGAIVAPERIMSSFSRNPVLGHITTFGGHPVSCSCGLAAMQVLIEEGLVDDANRKGLIFDHLLTNAAILKKNRIGLWMSLEFESFELNKKIIDLAIENGLVTDWFLFAPNKLRIAPPLTISDDEIHAACAILNDAIEKATNECRN